MKNHKEAWKGAGQKSETLMDAEEGDLGLVKPASQPALGRWDQQEADIKHTGGFAPQN